jgi:hypothetical protein
LALQGTLDTFSLPDVLRLLATTSKTGRLRIEGDRGQGSVWLSEGSVVDAAADRAVDGTPTDEVVFELLRFDSGTFAFDADVTASSGGNPQAVDDLLRRAGSLLNEWSELEAVVPSLQHHVSLAGDLSVDEVTIDADKWRSVVAVASGRTVGELATELGLTELGVSRAVRDLVELGVADVDAPDLIPDPPRRPEPAVRDLASQPVPNLEPITGEHRAGWLTGDRTGEMPVPAPDPLASRPGVGNNQTRASHDEPAPAPPEAPAKGGLASRLGRSADSGSTPAVPNRPTTADRPLPASRNGAASPPGTAPVVGSAADADRPRAGRDATTPPASRAGESGRTPRPRPEGRPPARPADTGRTPVTPGDAGRPPLIEPGDTGRTPIARPGDTGRTPIARPGDTGRNPIARTGETGAVPPPGPAPTAGPPSRRDPGAPRRGTPSGRPARPARPGSGNGSSLTGPSSPFDGGHLGPSPLQPGDTGQIRPVNPSQLPPDLHWAADDTGPVSSPFSGLTSLGPTRPAPAPHDGEIAPHVAAMSPEARAAGQSTVGNAGGSGGRATGPGEDSALRGRLINFLSTVR